MLLQSHSPTPIPKSLRSSPHLLTAHLRRNHLSFPSPPLDYHPIGHRTRPAPTMASDSKLYNHSDSLHFHDLDHFAAVGNTVADAAGDVIRQYFRKKFDILDKEDFSPVTIADQAAEESMISILLESFPSHAIYGEESGWKCKDKFADYVWVLDPIDGTKSFITDSWDNRSAHFEGTMDWDKRKENYIERARSLYPFLCKTISSIFVHYKSTSFHRRSRRSICSCQK